MKQRLTINPDTFLWLEDKYGLLYDSGSFASYKFRLTPQISQLCDRLQTLTTYIQWRWTWTIQMTSLGTSSNR